MSEAPLFKKCPMCATIWKSRKDSLDDKSLDLNGYQADFKDLNKGLFYFTHRVDNCYSTLVIETAAFLSLYTGVTYSETLTGSDQCSSHCFKKDLLDYCDAHCRYASVREVIKLIKAYKKGT